MKPALATAPLTALLLLAEAAAQDLAPKDSERDPVLADLLERGSDAPSPGVDDDAENPDADAAAGETNSVLVVGQPPGETFLLEDGPEPLAEVPEDEASDPAGVEIDVEPGADDVTVDDEAIDIVAPFPAKRLAPPPPGWKIVHPDDTPVRTETVTLANGQTVSLAIRPHVLIPEADGAEVFALSEPGFDSALGYDQTQTVGSILAESIHQLDEQDARLTAAANRLSELLDSLPPTDEPTDTPEP